MKINNLKGWFPPCIISTISGRYACCGENWEPIDDNITIKDVMDSWTCTAPVYIPKVKSEKIKTKRLTKKQLNEKASSK